MVIICTKNSEPALDLHPMFTVLKEWSDNQTFLAKAKKFLHPVEKCDFLDSLLKCLIKIAFALKMFLNIRMLLVA